MRSRWIWSESMATRVAALGVLLVMVGAVPVHAADEWIKPTPEELAMTSLPGYPGAPAVILFREQVTRDDLHVVQHYERIKILNEKGKDYANVELTFASSFVTEFDSGDDKNITDISGCTIHSDGTVIPFTGKPYLKMIEKAKKTKYQARVFTLPDVEVGSIIEYRYATRIADDWFEPPNWFVQDDLFTKSAHFLWYPTTKNLVSSEGEVSTISWYPLLPPGLAVDRKVLPSSGTGKEQQIYELNVHDVAPQPDEEYMPPIKSFTYRVLFAYSAYRSGPEFWKNEGKRWSKRQDSFVGPDGPLKAATQTVIAGAQTQDEKLRKIYAAVMALENTDFTRSHDLTEDKNSGVGKVSNAGDVYQHGRGTGDQLAEVFVGMARAAGMKAYLMIVPDRSKRLMTDGWMSFSQFDNYIAIVNVDGKEQFFDPGQRYCPYGQLAWVDTFGKGLRQTDGGTDFAIAPGSNYKATTTQRIADLSMDVHGEIAGTISMTYTGSAALYWRQRALSGDDESTKTAMRTALDEVLPKTLEVKVSSIENLTDYEKPLVAHFEVKGGFGTPTGKRMILPADVFLAEETATFPHEKREQPVYFQYPETVADAMRIKFPPTMAVEAMPTAGKAMFQDLAAYDLSATQAPDSFTVHRNTLMNFVIVPVKDYGELRTFYSQMETKDKDSVVLKMADGAGAPAGN